MGAARLHPIHSPFAANPLSQASKPGRHWAGVTGRVTELGCCLASVACARFQLRPLRPCHAASGVNLATGGPHDIGQWLRMGLQSQSAGLGSNELCDSDFFNVPVPCFVYCSKGERKSTTT